VTSRLLPRAHHCRDLRAAAVLVVALLTGACSSLPRSLPASGPTTEAVERAAASAREQGIQVIPITDAIARSILSRADLGGLAEAMEDSKHRPLQVGGGDTLEVSLWEAPPSVLFGVTHTDPRLLAGTAIVTHLPPQVVDGDGSITVPFAGRIRAAGQTPREIERTIATRLRGKTNQIQVLVRISQNASSNVTVVGEVRNSARVALTPKGERLLDVLAAAGGVTQPLNKITLQVTRGERIRSIALDRIVRDPGQNIVMQPGDVVTALHQPYAFSVLGAAGRNEEIPFEANGITLTQALARSGGVNDNRADRRGVFVFRFENPAVLDLRQPLALTPDGKVPVIYQLDLENPASFLVAQNFPIQHKDVLYVSNAPAAELQKFLNIVSSIATPILAARSLTR
jgi:polysaccharide export outer membrane protein